MWRGSNRYEVSGRGAARGPWGGTTGHQVGTAASRLVSGYWRRRSRVFETAFMILRKTRTWWRTQNGRVSSWTCSARHRQAYWTETSRLHVFRSGVVKFVQHFLFRRLLGFLLQIGHDIHDCLLMLLLFGRRDSVLLEHTLPFFR